MLWPLFKHGFEYLNILIFTGDGGCKSECPAVNFCVETIE